MSNSEYITTYFKKSYGILQWEREIGLNSKYSKWEIIAKEQGKGEILHKLATCSSVKKLEVWPNWGSGDLGSILVPL